MAARFAIRAAAIALLAFVLLGAISASASAVEAPPEGEAKEVPIYLPSPTNHRYVLELHLFPAKGVAVVDTYRAPVGYDVCPRRRLRDRDPARAVLTAPSI